MADAQEFEGEDALEAAIADNPEAVAELVRRLDAVNELLDVVDLGTSAMTDEMVRSLADTGASLGEVADTAARDDTRNGIVALLNSVDAAERAEPTAVGPVDLLRATRDPEIQQGLGYLLAVAKALGQQQTSADD